MNAIDPAEPEKLAGDATTVSATRSRHPDRLRVLVIGGGYAGVMCANRVARSGPSGPVVTLIDPNAQFTERIRLHQVLAGNRASAAQPWGTVLSSRVHRLQDSVLRIDTAAHRVTLESGAIVGWDRLVYAVGSGAATRPGPGTPATVQDARRRMLALPPDSVIRVAGAGLTGLETVTALATANRHTRLVLHAPLGLVGQSPAGTRHILRRLKRLGVTVTPEPADLTSDTRGELVLDCTGFRLPDLAARSGLPTDDRGRLAVDDTLAVAGHPDIIAAGDAAVVQGAAGEHLRMACATAIPQGAHAADTILAGIRSLTPRQLDIGYIIRCLDLGAGQGHIQMTGRDDRNLPAAVTGRLGGAVKELICSLTVTALTQEARGPGRYRRPVGAPTNGNSRR